MGNYNIHKYIPKLEYKLSVVNDFGQTGELKDHEIFVFGSKPSGEHINGVAKTALNRFGAVMGVSKGLRGQSYAIPVHTHRTQKMDVAVKEFIAFAKANPDKIFILQPIGCGSAGMDVKFVSEMFSPAICVDNILMPKIFIEALIDNRRHDDVIAHTDYPNLRTLRYLWRKKLSKVVEPIDYGGILGTVNVPMDCSIGDAVDLIIDMCIPMLKWYYPELKYRIPLTDKSFWLNPNLEQESLALNQITEGWVQCIKYHLGYTYYAPRLTREDIVRCLTYKLCLYGPYFDAFEY